VESISKANARQPAIQRPYNTQSIRIEFNRDQRSHHIQLQGNWLA